MRNALLVAVLCLAAAMSFPAKRAVAQASSGTPEIVRGQPISLEAGTGVLLTLPQPASTVLSAQPSIARVQPASPTSMFLMGVAAGHTTVIATTVNGAPIVQYDVTVTSGKSATNAPPPMPNLLGPITGGDEGDSISAETALAVEKSIRKMVPGAAGLTATAVGSRLFLGGSVTNAAAGQQAEAIARSKVGPNALVVQFTVLNNATVNVRVRFAEISRSIERQLGFNWQVLGASGAWRTGTLSGSATTNNATYSGVASAIPGISGTSNSIPGSFFDPRFPLGLSSKAAQTGIGYATKNWDINGIIDALATDSLVTILAEPNLTAQSGEAASFLAGGEFPIPVAGSSSNGNASITVVFKQYGVSLEVVPTVLSSGRLNLRIRPEVSQLSTEGAVSVPVGNGTLTIPALTVRRAETTVELGSGQSFAIAGLLQKTTTDSTRAVPGAGELPVIGALFRSSDFQRGDSELVIIVTPYLVRPTSSPAALQTPIDNIRPATDLDRILLGHQIAGAGGTPLNAGFILK
jgi:pilus assembly protein CpaC